MKEMPNSICGNTAVGGNYNSTCDNYTILKERIEAQVPGCEVYMIHDGKLLVQDADVAEKKGRIHAYNAAVHKDAAEDEEVAQ